MTEVGGSHFVGCRPFAVYTFDLRYKGSRALQGTLRDKAHFPIDVRPQVFL